MYISTVLLLLLLQKIQADFIGDLPKMLLKKISIFELTIHFTFEGKKKFPHFICNKETYFIRQDI
jgi:hypothetical protein